eukprot:CAMPEP_0185042402 /NCGR_PEP_ID=MMETSP1103-20130426/42328_1 /TAXON_ID=36769 /ORGANISM="Paraphysomonas bandaiensis, Strain Caron Lab Isolate" /LENGTH=896 /DNA_ID=CAMNT_0027582465 /DNA_START=456 /DNA_END=3150 /DNA_ORIENTATION=-
MMGNPVNDDAGVIPRLCRSVFHAVNERIMRTSEVNARGEMNENDYMEPFFTIDASIDVAYYEIYNERVYDLLSETPETPSKVRERPGEGAYVEGLVMRPVKCYDDVHMVLEEGHSKRQVAETSMNAESSRSHAIFTMFLRQKVCVPTMECQSLKEIQPIQRRSKVCLIDLAGSERINSTGATGDRLKEATNINKSLFVLGDVIKSLSEMVEGGGDKFVPYRNSTLTWILKDSLGGNSRTTMLATISPIDASYSESMNTLRYVERAKLIMSNAVVNDDNSNDPYVKHLQQQLALYKGKLSAALMSIREKDAIHQQQLCALQSELDAVSSGSITQSKMLRGNSDDLKVDILACSSDFSDDEAISEGNTTFVTDRHRGEHLCIRDEVGPNEIESLKKSLRTSLMEYEMLNQRMLHADDMHKIEVQFLEERVRSLECDMELAAVSPGSPSERENEERVGGLHIIIEQLRIRLESVESELYATQEKSLCDSRNFEEKSASYEAVINRLNEELQTERRRYDNDRKKYQLHVSSLNDKLRKLDEDNNINMLQYEAKIAHLSETVSDLMEETEATRQQLSLEKSAHQDTAASAQTATALHKDHISDMYCVLKKIWHMTTSRNDKSCDVEDFIAHSDNLTDIADRYCLILQHFNQVFEQLRYTSSTRDEQLRETEIALQAKTAELSSSAVNMNLSSFRSDHESELAATCLELSDLRAGISSCNEQLRETEIALQAKTAELSSCRSEHESELAATRLELSELRADISSCNEQLRESESASQLKESVDDTNMVQRGGLAPNSSALDCQSAEISRNNAYTAVPLLPDQQMTEEANSKSSDAVSSIKKDEVSEHQEQSLIDQLRKVENEFEEYRKIHGTLLHDAEETVQKLKAQLRSKNDERSTICCFS